MLAFPESVLIHLKPKLWHFSLLHSERPKLYTIFAFLSAVGLSNEMSQTCLKTFTLNLTLHYGKTS